MGLLLTAFIRSAHAVSAYAFIDGASPASLVFQEDMLSGITKSRTDERIFR